MRLHLTLLRTVEARWGYVQMLNRIVPSKHGMVKYPDSVMGQLVVLPKNIPVKKECHMELWCDHLENCFAACWSEVFIQDI